VTDKNKLQPVAYATSVWMSGKFNYSQRCRRLFCEWQCKLKMQLKQLLFPHARYSVPS